MKMKKGTLFISVGLLLIVAAVCLVGYNVYKEISAASASGNIANTISEMIPKIESEKEESEDFGTDNQKLPTAEDKEIPDYVLNPNMEMPTLTIDGNDYIGLLRIPSLGLELPVMSSWSYAGLNISPCRYSGSAYTEDMVIAAHNYRCHFADIQYLEEGDRVTFTDAKGNVFHYTVVLREILDATAVEDMTNGSFPLTLFTCNSAGYARITVRCENAE